LDPAAERHIADSYEAAMRGRTTIVITHRLELAARAGRVLELDGSRVLECSQG
jgi:ATP-binding cassette subfamily B protein